jgi:hypothetical protein
MRVLAFPGQELVSPGQSNFGVIGFVAQPLTQLYRIGLGNRLAALEGNSAREDPRLNLQETANFSRCRSHQV